MQCFESLTDSRVDKAAGVIRGVCVVETGEAKGHNVWVDSQTLQTVLDAGKKFAEGLKVKFRHGKSGEYQNVLEETFGLLKNFCIEGSKVRADLYLLESLPADIRSKAFEMAEKMANQFGLSIVFKGTNEKIGGRDYLRCTALESTDLTDKPAATSGLFSMSEKSIKYENGKDGGHAKDCQCAECESKSANHKMESLSADLKALTDLVTGLAEKMGKTAPAAPAVTALEYKDKEGKTIQLSAEAIVTRLEAADKAVADAKKSTEASERKSLIDGIVRDGRVILKDDGVAYKFEELSGLPMDFLKFAAKNAPVIPTQARATYTGTTTPPDTTKKFTKNVSDGKGGSKEIALAGEELAAAAWETKYGDIDAMIAKHNHNLSN